MLGLKNDSDVERMLAEFHLVCRSQQHKTVVMHYSGTFTPRCKFDFFVCVPVCVYMTPTPPACLLNYILSPIP